MTLKLRITGGPGNTEVSLRNEFRKRARGLERAAKAVSDFTPAFLVLDDRLDAQIRQVFKQKPGWAPWADRTKDNRAHRRNWYSQAGGGSGIGVWTGKMQRGLMGRAPNGSIRNKPFIYSRTYRTAGEVFGGRDVTDRVITFHKGGGKQPARPLWRENQREEIAIAVILKYVQNRIVRPAQGERSR